jgi:opacity protein-like surface antigen
MTLQTVLFACALLLPAIASAQSVKEPKPVQGLYLDLGAGTNIADSRTSSDSTTQIGTNPGPVGLVGLGWGFGNGLRAELEGSFRVNNVSGVSAPNALSGASGNLRT